MKILASILISFIIGIIAVGFTEPMWKKWFIKPKQNSTGPGETNDIPNIDDPYVNE